MKERLNYKIFHILHCIIVRCVEGWSSPTLCTSCYGEIKQATFRWFKKKKKSKASIPTDDLIPLVRHCRNDHSMAYQVPIANTDIHKCSFFPQAIRDWNPLPDSLIFSAEGAEDGVAKFTSLVRARD